MTLNRFVRLACVGTLAALFASAGQAQEYTLSINTALATNDPLYAGLESFVEAVDERSEGRLAVRLFPNSQLGPDEDVLEQARAGAPVAVVVDGGRLAVYVKEFGILGAPYLASGYDGMRKVVTSPLFAEWVEALREASGHQVLSFNWWQGERHVVANKPVATPEDLNGLRLRTPGAPVWTATVAAMGATPTPLPFADVYSGIQQNVVDGTEVQLPAFIGANLQEVISDITKTGHINLITGLVTSATWFDSLPEDLQTILLEEALAAGDVASYGTQDALAQIEADLTEAGVAIHEIDTTPFVEATAGVYEELGYSALRDAVQDILAQ